MILEYFFFRGDEKKNTKTGKEFGIEWKKASYSDATPLSTWRKDAKTQVTFLSFTFFFTLLKSLTPWTYTNTKIGLYK